MTDRLNKPQVLLLTVDEMSCLGVLATLFVETDGKLGRLAELPISDNFKSAMKSASEKIDKKLHEISQE